MGAKGKNNLCSVGRLGIAFGLVLLLTMGCSSDEREWGSVNSSVNSRASEAETEAGGSLPSSEAQTSDPPTMGSDGQSEESESCFGQCESTSVSDVPFQTKADAFGDSDYSIVSDDAELEVVPNCLVSGVSFSGDSLIVDGDSTLVEAWSESSGASAGQFILRLTRSAENEAEAIAGSLHSATEVAEGFHLLGLGTEAEFFSYQTESRRLVHTISQSFEIAFGSNDDDDDDASALGVTVAEATVSAVLTDNCTSLTEVEVRLLIPDAQKVAAFGDENLVEIFGAGSSRVTETAEAAYELVLTGSMMAGEER